ncbi:unnamed protein product [Withania somnifera]
MSSTVGQVIHCKAAVAWEPGKPLVIEEVEVAPPQKMEVRLKVLYTSLWHTDVYFWEAKGQNPVFPRILGHEGAVMIQSRFSINGKPIYHFVGTSTFSEYTLVHVGCVTKINPLTPLDKVCVLSYGILTGIAAEGARIAGASRIIGVDLNASRFEQAKQFGVTEFVNPKDYSKPVQEVINEMTDGGVDRSVECTGHIDAMISAFECAPDVCFLSSNFLSYMFLFTTLILMNLVTNSELGVAVLVGVHHKEAVFKTHPMNLLNERTLKGTFSGNYKPRSDLPSVVEKYMSKELELEKFITHTVPFAQINKAFYLTLKGEGLRCIITMGD